MEYTHLLKEKMKDFSHDVVCTDPGASDENTQDELGKIESVIWKPSLAKLRYSNTYKMEPRKKFVARVVKRKMEQILQVRLEGIKYDPDICRSLSISLANDILTAVKHMKFDRYKYIVQVLIMEKSGQGTKISSKWLWDIERDNWTSVRFETASFVAVGLVFSIYYE
ncbi:dynein light chain Tctex-type protein 2 isoform X2 [Ascaphus truei]|uniref:dynein light chain Tctex-type protein 2 isoform X2 n=1 Tax=Ascaphus truei TaxID=8439 RepID=UPI003F597C32